MEVYRLEVPGVPVPQGSTRAFAMKIKGTEKYRAVTTNQTDKLRKYRKDIVAEAAKQFQTPFDNPCGVSVHFFLPRPKSHYGSKKGQPYLKESAPMFHVTKPDVDKLLRAVMDGLTGVALKDDSQVVSAFGFKSFIQEGMEPATWISITPYPVRLPEEKL